MGGWLEDDEMKRDLEITIFHFNESGREGNWMDSGKWLQKDLLTW